MRHAALELAIGGMSCAGCAASPDAALGRVAGVAQVIVNLGTERASIAYDADLTSVPSLIQAVEGTGFQERTETATLPIRGMTCAACVNSVERGLRQTNGVLSATAHLATGLGTVPICRR